MSENSDWIFDKQSDVTGPAERVLAYGPDSMRPGASRNGGTGEAFIFLPNGELLWATKVGHESMLDPQYPKFHHMLEVLFGRDGVAKLADETSVNGVPFVDHYTLRRRMIPRAIFGRVGNVSGFQMVSLWPGTEHFETLVPQLIDKLLQEDKINEDTRVTIGRTLYYTVGHFLHRRQEVLSQMKADNNDGKRLLNQGPASAAEIRLGREKDKESAAQGKGFRYDYRWGESFGSWLSHQEKALG